MQFRLRSLMIVMAIICIYCGILNAPPFIAIPIYCSVVWLTPAYWIAGVIYAREAKRAFFIGGLAAGTIPFAVLSFFMLAMVMDGPWGYWRFGNGVSFGEYQLINLFASLVIFAPVVLAFIGGWISYAVYLSVQRPKPSPPPRSPFELSTSLPAEHSGPIRPAE